MKLRKYRLPLFLLVLAVFFSLGYIGLAQKEQKIAQPQETADAQSVETVAQQSEGISGVADEAVVVNFSELARRESETPPVYKEPKVVRAPGTAPRHKTVPVEGGAVIEQQSAEPFFAPGETWASSPPAASSFRALEDNNTSIPPDTNGAVGPNHLMVVLNTQVRIQTKLGATISTVSLDGFWSSVPGPWAGAYGPTTFDPKVLYDPFNSRWIFAAMADPDEPTSAILIGVSLTSDPTGNWKLFKVDADSTDAAWADYTSIGFNKNWIVVTANMFSVGSSATFKRVNIYAFNKASLYAGTAPFKLFTDANGFTMAPAVTYDNALNTLYMVEDWDGHTQLRISSLTGTAAVPAYSATHYFPAAPAASAWASQPANGDDFAPQLGSTHKIQTGDSRIQNVVYRNGSLWCAQTIFLPNTATPTHSSVQWWQLAPTGAIQQRARIDDPAAQIFYAYPSIAVNKNNDVLIGYSRFSSQQYASANYSSRAATDPVNTLRTDVVLKAGSAPYYKTFDGTENRWGDYSNTVVDPANDLDMWTIQERAAPVSGGFDHWETWWGRIGPSTPTPLIEIGTVTATDSGGDPDTNIEPGEGGRLTIQLKNVGNGAATSVSATLTTSTPGVTITSGNSAYPNLAAVTGAGTNTTPFTFNVASTVPCGQVLSFTLTVTYTGPSGPSSTVAFLITVLSGKASTTAVTKTYTGPVVPIPDNNSTGVNISLPVSGFTGKISDLNFKIGGTTCTTATTVGIDHTWVGDLVLTLKSPQGTVVTLINQAGGVNNSGDNFCNTTLDDESAGGSIQLITPAQAPYTGSFKPNSPLSAFDGEDPNGTWVLNVSDRGFDDTGNVRSFSLIITPTACSTTDALLSLGTVTATDGNTADADTIIEPGETNNKLTVQLKNTGNGPATAVSGKLTTSTAGVTITTSTSAYPNLAAAGGVGTNTTPFTFNVASTVPCGQFLIFTLTVTYTGGSSPQAFTIKVPTGQPGAAVTKTYTGPVAAIPDNTTTGVSISFAVSGFTGRIKDLNFKFGGMTCTTAAGATTVGLDHTWVGNLVVTLKSPQGTIITLMSRPGGIGNNGHNFCNTVLDDESAGGSIQSVTAAQAPYAASFKPAAALSAFDGQDPNGTWVLNVSDRAAADTGNVRTFSLIITPAACSTTALLTPFDAPSEWALASLSPDELFATTPFVAQSDFLAWLQTLSRLNAGQEAGAISFATPPQRCPAQEQYSAALLAGPG